MTEAAAAAKEWLERNHDIYAEINGMYMKLEEMRAAAARLVSVPQENKVQTQPDPHSIETRILGLLEFEKRIDDKYRLAVASDEQTRKTILKLRSGKERVILLYRYYNRLPWKEIAENLKYSVPHCYELHASGLEHIAPLIDYTIT